MKTVLYVDMWKGDAIQEMKLAGIRRYANRLTWRIIQLSEEKSRPGALAEALSRLNPDGSIVECSAAHEDLPPMFFGRIPTVYLDCDPALYGAKATKVLHDNVATTHLAFRELSANRPQSYAIVGYRARRPWTTIREKTFLAIVKETSGNEVVSTAIQKVHDAVKEGEGIAVPLNNTKIFPPMVISMVEVGEETGNLPEMLEKIADTYDEEVDNSVSALTSLIEPLMIVGLAGIVGSIVIALFMPLVRIIEKMGQGAS